MSLLICIFGIILKMKEFVIQWRKFELKRSYINEFMNFLIFQNYFDFILIFQDLFNHAGPAEVTWHDADTWRGHRSPHGCLRGAYAA